MRVLARWLAVVILAVLVLSLAVFPAIQRAAAVQSLLGWNKSAGLPTMPGAGLVGDVTVIDRRWHLQDVVHSRHVR